MSKVLSTLLRAAAKLAEPHGPRSRPLQRVRLTPYELPGPRDAPVILAASTSGCAAIIPQGGTCELDGPADLDVATLPAILTGKDPVVTLTVEDGAVRVDWNPKKGPALSTQSIAPEGDLPAVTTLIGDFVQGTRAWSSVRIERLEELLDAAKLLGAEYLVLGVPVDPEHTVPGGSVTTRPLLVCAEAGLGPSAPNRGHRLEAVVMPADALVPDPCVVARCVAPPIVPIGQEVAACSQQPSVSSDVLLIAEAIDTYPELLDLLITAVGELSAAS